VPVSNQFAWTRPLRWQSINSAIKTDGRVQRVKVDMVAEVGEIAVIVIIVEIEGPIAGVVVGVLW
jgi:hypothetical protein